MNPLWQDLRYSVRMLGKNPGFTAIAILTLTLGIGANTAIFHLIDAVLLRNLPVSDPKSLVDVQIKGGNHGFGVNAGDETFLTYPLWEQIRENQKSLVGAFAWESWDFQIGKGSQEKSVTGLWVSGEMFPALGIVPIRGRLLRSEDDRPGCGTPGVVLSYGFWQSEFGGQDSAVGSKLLIDDHPVEIIGVTPANFTGLEVGKTFEIAVPFCSVTGFHADDNNLTRRDFFWVKVMGRLSKGVTVGQVSAELEALNGGIIEATIPQGYSNTALDNYRRYKLAAYPAATGVSQLRQTYDTSLWLLLGITGLVLLIACANIANLMLARASSRKREMAVRLALGASRWRLIEQLLLEGLVLAAVGGVLGAGLAGVLSRGLVSLISTEANSLQLDLRVDWRVLAFVTSVAALTCVIFGLAPSFRSSRMAPSDAIKSGSRSATSGRESLSLQRILVISQITISLILLVGALLFVHSFWNLTKVDPGFRKNGILFVSLDMSKLQLPQERYEPVARDLLTQIRSIPLVEAAATSTHLPFYGSWTSGVNVDGTEGPSKFTWVSPDYLRTLQVPLIAGRDFDDRDTSSSPRVAIVSESFVRRFLGGRNAIGRIIRTAPEPNYPAASYQIVGIVKDTKYADLREEIPPPQSYAPASQFPNAGPWVTVLIRSSSPLGAVTEATRAKLGSVNPNISMEFVVLKTSIEDRLVRERMLALLSGAFGLLATLLAMTGLYGVISYIVALRRTEIGIRMALGASRGDVVSIIIRQTTALLVAGLSLGILFALLAAQGASTLLFGVTPADPATVVGASLFLISVALAASYIPVRRATRVDPMVALRYE